MVAMLAAAAAVDPPMQTAGELPFEVTRADLLTVDTAAIRWRTLRTYVGGVEAEFVYVDTDVDGLECRAAAVIAMARVRNRYKRDQGSEPLALKMDFHCGTLYRGAVRYDGMTTSLEIVDRSNGDRLYAARMRGLP